MTVSVGINSYVTTSEADSYFDDRLYAADWLNADSDDQEKALLMGRRVIDRQTYQGSLTDDNQVLAWPRQGVVDSEGRAVNEDTVPQAIKDAQCELALAFLKEDLTEDDSARGVRRLKAGSVEVEYDGRAPARQLPEAAAAFLKPFLAIESNPNSVRIAV